MTCLIWIAWIVGMVVIAHGISNTPDRWKLKVMAAGVIIFWLSVIASIVAQSSTLVTGICLAIIFTGFFMWCRPIIRASLLKPSSEG